MFFLSAALAGAPTLTIVAVGDILPHRRVKASAAAKGWAEVFGPVSAQLRSADLAFANLESPIAPDHHVGIHGEVFNAPSSLASGLREAGFDVVSMANNHVWDQGVAGMLETRDRVLAQGIYPIGVGHSCAEAQAPYIIERNGIRVGWLAMVDLLNTDLRATPTAPCVHVAGPLCTADCGADRDALFYRADTAALHDWIASVRPLVDVLIVSTHWGNEYRITPLPEYPPIAEAMIAAGADVVLGHHPHVLQPIEWVEAGGRRGLVAYSLGNFVSDMGRRYDPTHSPVRRGDTRDGVILTLTITKTDAGLTIEPSTTPTWTDNAASIQVIPQSALPPKLRAVRKARVREVLKLQP